MFKKAVQRGRSERGGEAYSLRYVEPPSDARTKLAAFFNILLLQLKPPRATGISQSLNPPVVDAPPSVKHHRLNMCRLGPFCQQRPHGFRRLHIPGRLQGFS